MRTLSDFGVAGECHGVPSVNDRSEGLRGHFVLRAIGKRFRKDRTAGCEKVVGIRFALDSSLEEAGFEPSVPPLG